MYVLKTLSKTIFKSNQKSSENVITKNVMQTETPLDPDLKKSFMAPFYGWGSTASRLEPLWGGSLLFTTKFLEIPGNHFIDLWRVNGWVDLGATH